MKSEEDLVVMNDTIKGKEELLKEIKKHSGLIVYSL